MPRPMLAHPQPSGSFDPTTGRNLKRAHEAGAEILVAWPEGWKSCKIHAVTTDSRSGRLQSLCIETEHGGLMEIRPGDAARCILVRSERKP